MSAVLFMDVLGTKALANSSNAASTLLHLDQALRDAREQSQLGESWNWTDSSWFSDNLAIASPFEKPDEAEGIVSAITSGAAWIQLRLALEGYFTRGGFAVGEHFMDSEINFGPALVEAVDLERAAREPRIILSENATQLIDLLAKSYASGLDNPYEEEFMVDDVDGVTFISYLSMINEIDDASERQSRLEQHKENVQHQLQLNASVPEVHSKFLWLAHYHNAFCKAFYSSHRGLQIRTGEELRLIRPYK